MGGNLEAIWQKTCEINDKLDVLPGQLRLNANQIVVTVLDQLSNNMGLIGAGEFRCGNNRNPGDSFSGLRIAYPTMQYPANSTESSDAYNLVGVDADTLQVGIRSSDGMLVAGGGAIELSSTGLLASAGVIGGWDITSSEIHKSGITLDATVPEITIGDTAQGKHIRIIGSTGAESIESANFSSGSIGFKIWADTANLGDAEFNNIVARGLFRTAVFQKDVVSCVGGELYVIDADVLEADMSSQDSTTMTIKATTSWDANDILRIKDDLDDEWFLVGDTSNHPAYAITRDQGSGYAANENPEWKKGSSIVNYGASGEGGVRMFGSDVPYFSIFTHAAAPWTTITDHVRLIPTLSLFGEDISAAATTAVAIMHTAQTYNSEELGAGDLLIGDNSASKANILWDKSTGKLQFRGATTMQCEIGTDGKLYAGGGDIKLDSSGITIVADNAARIFFDVSGTKSGYIFAHNNPNTVAIQVEDDQGGGDKSYCFAKWIVNASHHAEVRMYSNSLGGGADVFGGLTLGANVAPNATLDVRGDAIFNEAGADKDFRVESANNANMLFVDGGANRVGIGTATPTTALQVQSGTTFSLTDINDSILIGTNDNAGDDNYGGSIGFCHLSSAVARRAAIAAVQTSADGDQVGLAFFTHPATTNNNTIVEAMRIEHDGIVNYLASMDNSAKDPTTDAPADWVEIQIAGTTYYLPAYAVS